MLTALTPIAPTLAKCLRLLASDKDGEIVASVHAMRRVLNSAGAEFHTLASLIEATTDNPFSRMQPTTARAHAVRVMLRACRECSGLLTSKELAFVHSMTTWRGELSPRQFAWLHSLYERVEGERT